MSVVIFEGSVSSEKIEDTVQIKLVIEKNEEDGYTVTVPDLSGLITEGDTIEECVDNFQDALREYIRSFKRTRDKIPIDLTSPIKFEVEILE